MTTFGAPTPASSASQHYGHPALSGKIMGTPKIRFQTFVLYPEKHQIITFHTPRILRLRYPRIQGIRRCLLNLSSAETSSS
ncbi:hypothetical protein TNCV_3066171 [Trichonephila clavipes]|uniref:Uncharacterized protein n=1 Tax=Trichonephila clavipes TaxID=2585209 RepID=A0A8X6RNI7_TRICX|nr:hypothetical protein TNCV_3066171 [Trichonephila clavipes]